ncbi:lysophospholipid acyltransferase family protein [Reyranella aquatilis]|uniref:1-acyl-sn-glycerol-3-phosphate acyltransferase n=1 Tax=Reyranella aquatilis TaxID=2035356 RepID=A0ABS8KUN2_9HYPH|nr:lysophospholipid acyltransferase family protein [Reyranella aquatilis]MCC8429780.1 1-acyl-sn-glycerol-3-phosphate acyltransferase [Reyranella aquatilis]
MSSAADAPVAATWIGSPLRGAFRLLSYLLLTLVLLPFHLLALACRITPVVRWMPVFYHRTVCTILGIKVKVNGARSTVTPTLYVCNHVSYLDIEVLGGLIPGSFVAKAEVATWPFFSTLAKAQRTIFVERRSSKTSNSRDEMLRRLNTGDNLMLFPEGTSSDGTRVLPFRSALFAVAQLRRDDRPIVVQPVAISYTRLDGIPLGRYWRPLFAWFGDLDLVPHLWQMVCLGETEAVVTFFPPIDIDQLGDRKKLAEHCFRQVSSGVQAANSGRPELLPPLAEPAPAGPRP